MVLIEKQVIMDGLMELDMELKAFEKATERSFSPSFGWRTIIAHLIGRLSEATKRTDS